MEKENKLATEQETKEIEELKDEDMSTITASAPHNDEFEPEELLPYINGKQLYTTN